MNLFFAKKEKTTPKDAIINLRETLSMLEKREAHIQSKINVESKIARENATTNKRAAIAALKRKKLYEVQRDKMSGTRMTIEAQAMSIEAANVNLETLKAMQVGAKAMKQIHAGMDANTVDETLDQIREQMDINNEISDAISQPQLFGAEMDEDELAAELEELEQEELDKQLLASGTVPVSLPKSPLRNTPLSGGPLQNAPLPAGPLRNAPLPAGPPRKAPAPVEAEDEDDELAELRESMGMPAM
ncbi:ESCRT-III subunit protein snf7 [Coemansia spiralis]|uniref:Vacuolar-sorting protein SNF7 n=1 Tax=Coemansia spiralis TaxID=417178 RepID=A0A9W8L2X6_9FUNG|nr:ESCRT-III subunit protein snf7 [Coemansia spiralis]